MKNLIGISAAAAILRRHAAALVIGAALAAVAGTTGFISYTHICALTLVLHQSWKTAHLMPLAVDGQIIIGSVVLLALPGAQRWWGLVGIVPGLAESLFANWESGIAHGYLGAAWATVAAQAFAVSSFLFERWLKSQAGWGTGAISGTAAGQQAEDTSGDDGGTAPEVPHPLTPDLALQALLDSESDQVLALMLGLSRNRVRAWRGRLETAGEAGAEAGTPEPPSIRYAMNGSGAGA